MSFKTFVSGAVLTAAEQNTYLMQQAVIVCTAATRPSAPVEGMTIYETDTDLVYVYNGSAWGAWGGGAAWTSYTPTDTAIVVGNGTRVAAYRMTDPKTCVFRWGLIMGSTSTIGTGAAAGLPFTAASIGASQFQVVSAYYLDTGTTSYIGVGRITNSGTKAELFHAVPATGAGAVDATSPHTWATGDTIVVEGTIEIA